MDIFLVFPVHLFKNIKNLKEKKVYLIEDPIYFTDYKYHKLKIAYHRCTMKHYENYLKKNKINVSYINFDKANNIFYQSLKSNNIETYDPFDNKLSKKLNKILPKINILYSHNFLVNKDFLDENKDEFYKNGKYNHVGFGGRLCGQEP